MPILYLPFSDQSCIWSAADTVYDVHTVYVIFYGWDISCSGSQREEVDLVRFIYSHYVPFILGRKQKQTIFE
jgi:hypothetical protein